MFYMIYFHLQQTSQEETQAFWYDGSYFFNAICHLNISILPFYSRSRLEYFTFQLQMPMQMCDAVTQQNCQHPSDAYGGEYESYKTSSMSQKILSTTYENLHNSLALNNHDSLFGLL